MKNDSNVYVGLDVHKDSIVAAYAVELGEIQNLGNIGVLERDLNRLCTRMQSKAAHVTFVYEAGPCGYGLYRYLTKKGFACMVCAPSPTPATFEIRSSSTSELTHSPPVLITSLSRSRICSRPAASRVPMSPECR